MADEMDPDGMTDTRRLGELATILAVGLLRLHSRRWGLGQEREISRDNCLEPSPKASPPAINA